MINARSQITGTNNGVNNTGSQANGTNIGVNNAYSQIIARSITANNTNSKRNPGNSKKTIAITPVITTGLPLQETPLLFIINCFYGFFALTVITDPGCTITDAPLLSVRLRQVAVLIVTSGKLGTPAPMVISVY